MKNGAQCKVYSLFYCLSEIYAGCKWEEPWLPYRYDTHKTDNTPYILLDLFYLGPVYQVPTNPAESTVNSTIRKDFGNTYFFGAAQPQDPPPFFLTNYLFFFFKKKTGSKQPKQEEYSLKKL